MAKYDKHPFFVGCDEIGAQFLFEEPGCYIIKFGDSISINHTGPWTDHHAALVRQYDVNSASFNTYSFGERDTADFLLELPSLRTVFISLKKVKDLSAVSQLTQVRELRLGIDNWGLRRLGDELKPIGFSNLRNLKLVYLSWCAAFASVLECSTIEKLEVSNDCDRRLCDLDLTHLPKLRELALVRCPKLRSVALHPKAKITALNLGLCGSYQIDWPRMGPELEFLFLGGRLTFPLEDILQAPKLMTLMTTGIRKLPPLGFLRQLKHLCGVVLFAPPPGPKISAEDEAMIQEINGRGKKAYGQRT
jgi:hypothetical protein